MAAKKSNKPQMTPQGTARAKANATSQRLDSLIPNVATVYSPVKIYLKGATHEIIGSGSSFGSSDYGWTCPDGVTEVCVECYGAGGGGGGGAVTANGGGGGGGGGEYAREDNYPVIPGRTYSYFAAPAGKGGKSSQISTKTGGSVYPGDDGMATHFDLRSLGLDGGVKAHGGGGGDSSGIGVGGKGGTGSSNSVHYDGGKGGTSSSGIMSDNPIFGVSPETGVSMWYRLDDSTSGSIYARDYSTYKRDSVSLIKNSGAILTPVSDVTAPIQVPFGASQNWDGNPVTGEAQGNCWQFAHGSSSGYIGGIVAPSMPELHDMTGFTASCWVKGAPDASSSTDWFDGTHNGAVLVGNCDVTNKYAEGFQLYLNTSNGQTNINFNISYNSSYYKIAAFPGPSANDGLWHMVTAVFDASAGKMYVYLDGALQGTVNTTVPAIAGGAYRVTTGINYNTQNFGFKGYMSNVYVSSNVTPSSYISFAYGNGVATGGGGGGASGGSLGAGNAGTGGVATAGGSGGSAASASSSIYNGSGAGGDGGDNGANGSNGATSSPYSGGGGGAGSTANLPDLNVVEIPCTMSGVYNGIDANGNAAGQLYAVSAYPAPNETNPWYSTAATNYAYVHAGGAASKQFLGSQNSVLVFPSFADVSVSGSGSSYSKLNSDEWSIEKLSLRLTIETTNACNLVVSAWKSNTVIAKIASDSDISAGGGGSASTIYYIPAGDAGRQVELPLTNSTLTGLLSSLANSNGFSAPDNTRGCGILLGTLAGSTSYQLEDYGAWDSDEADDWHCTVHGADASDASLSATLLVTYTNKGATFQDGGDGSPGYIVVSYITPEGTPVATLLPEADTDSSNNSFAAGYTGPVNVFDPNASPAAVETWHDLSGSLANGWVKQNSSAPCRYKLIGYKTMLVEVQLNDSSASSGVFMQMPTGYTATQGQFVSVLMGGSGINRYSAMIQVSTGAGGNLTILNWTKQNGQYLGNFFISLD